MIHQKSRFYAKQRFISELPIAHVYFQVSHPRKRALKHSFLCKTHHQGISKVKLRPVKSLILQLWSNPGVGYESRTQGVHAVKLSLTPFIHLERLKRAFQIMRDNLPCWPSVHHNVRTGGGGAEKHSLCYQCHLKATNYSPPCLVLQNFKKQTPSM